MEKHIREHLNRPVKTQQEREERHSDRFSHVLNENLELRGMLGDFRDIAEHYKAENSKVKAEVERLQGIIDASIEYLDPDRS